MVLYLPSEGFKILLADVKTKRITTDFLIETGAGGRIGFDEWLLYEASYPYKTQLNKLV